MRVAGAVRAVTLPFVDEADQPDDQVNLLGVLRAGVLDECFPATFALLLSLRQIMKDLFGDELVSDKSLDEVILSYLAEDLDPPHRK